MKLLITGRHTDVSKPIQQYIRKRFQKWATFLGPDVEVHVVVSVQGYRQEVEVHAANGRYSLDGRQTTKDMRSSIDLLAEKIHRQLSRQHERRLADFSAEPPAPPEPKAGKPARREVRGGRIVEVETWAGKPMTREEAALELEGARQAFLVFEDAETGQLAVLIRRKDGDFKLILQD